MMEKTEKNQRIADAGKTTKLRRESMSCKVYCCKVDKSHLSKRAAEFLRMSFLEAKWLINDIIASKDIFSSDYKNKTVVVLKDGKTPEDRQITHLPSQIRQSLLQKLQQDIFNLSKSKEKGNKIGGLNFRKEVKCLPLNQVGVTFKIFDVHHVHIQGNKGLIRVQGLGQIPKEAEIAKAELIHKINDYYIHFTCFVPKEQREETGKMIGVDFGITDNLTTSDGDKYSIKEEESKRLRKLQRGLNRMVKGSKNYVKTLKDIETEYQKINNRKDDQENKIVHEITTKNDVVICQDENIVGWKNGRYGKQVQHSRMGGIMRGLKNKSPTFIQVDRFFASTQTCDVCRKRQKVELSERVFVCEQCGNTKDRDTHSAINIKQEGLKQLSAMRNAEHVKSPVELLTNRKDASSGLCTSVAVNQEAHAL
jgi:putative transposase